ncbi:MAG: ATP-binding protein, partial [Bacteroidota bacterium]
IHNNLLSNAIKFTPPGGEVEVRVEQANPRQVSLVVKDSGIGISPEQLPKIFDRFYQAENEQTQAGEGTGIGLSLTKELVQFMEGYIEVESSPGTGTTFHVGLPITQLAPLKQAEAATLPMSVEAPAVPPPASVTQGSEMPSLLIIEDNPDLITYLYACLEDSYQLLLARDGEEGIRVALEQVPDLILSDVMMPKKNGYEVCDTLKSDERTSHIPIILLTAKADRDSRLTGLQRGADAYLTKPFDQEELLIRLGKLLELRKQLQARYAGSALELPPQEAEFQLEDAFMQRVNETIQANLGNSAYRTEELCRDLGISRTQLHHKIKALTNRSTALYIRHVRIEKAKALLRETDQRISDIGYAVGFEDSHYFSRVFTKEAGMSAKDWRAQAEGAQ